MMATAKPVRFQRKRTPGWRMQQASRAINGLPAVYVGRPTIWGNPFEDAASYRAWLHRVEWYPGAGKTHEQWAAIRRRLPELRGKNLCCWCGPEDDCHADVLLELANKEEVADQ